MMFAGIILLHENCAYTETWGGSTESEFLIKSGARHKADSSSSKAHWFFSEIIAFEYFCDRLVICENESNLKHRWQGEFRRPYAMRLNIYFPEEVVNAV